jgi:hypothetical protein
MPLLLQNKLTSELPGQSTEVLCPLRLEWGQLL